MRTFAVFILSIASLCCDAGPLYLPSNPGHFVHCTRKDGGNLFTDRFHDDLRCHGMFENDFVDYVMNVWRNSGIAVGDKTNCGLVIKIARPIAKIQTVHGEAWLRIDDLVPLIELTPLVKSKDGKAAPLQESLQNYLREFNPQCKFKLNAN